MIRYFIAFMNNFLFLTSVLAHEAPKPWSGWQVDETITQNVLYLPIADEAVSAIAIDPLDEEVVDLLEINNPRIQPLSTIDSGYQNTYKGFSKVRLGLYKRLVKMLEFLPRNVGIAYFEGLRPLWKQKEYFDKKFKEILSKIPDPELAYRETTKHVSPFIDNIPTHATGAAIDITLFKINKDVKTMLNMGMFDTIYGHNPAQETFSENTTKEQRENRLILLNAAVKSDLVNYGFEWWHYSYGDKAWAYVKAKKAMYGLAVEQNDPILLINKASYLRSFQ
ncbi:D-alanyl-D-alanine dipeptidase domain protein [Rickettsiales endosymbiont of Paramecium tredecaurelia]|uniref:M15 family metallopeptidase n=1 Tax=Candidatus Sarmatiella mevalonica TaxID=2770581 RepID=UPI001923F0ED|nr:M15 family metallopeptidase [Candidatus Sarmatiella mevalonica]MBL3285264.1 D-alanyl-D-alanine dipeptidase domain protein [Candidatus Sarmatiella mevalonica]